MHENQIKDIKYKKDLKFIKYDDTIDPYLHLCIYSYEVSLITMDEDLHANLFPFSLIGNALKWFSRLPHGNITNFNQVKSAFHTFYQIYIPKKVTLSDLMHIKQREVGYIESYKILDKNGKLGIYR